jgi:hypothetical protein
MKELLEFIADLLPEYQREGIMSEATVFAEHLNDHTTETVLNGHEANDDEDTAVGDDIICVYDMRKLLTRPKRKWYAPGRRTTKKKGICVHHTAVKDGFGVHRPTRYAFAQGISGVRAGVMSSWNETLTKLVEDKALFRNAFNEDNSDDALARMHALGSRYRGRKLGGAYGAGQPYHAITGANGVLYLNLPFAWVTWHGNGANSEFIGYAWDGNSTKESAPVDTVIDSIVMLAKIMKSEGHRCDELTVHSAWTNKPHDPGAEFIEDIIIPAAEKIGAVVHTEFSSGKGRPISGILGDS